MLSTVVDGEPNEVSALGIPSTMDPPPVYHVMMQLQTEAVPSLVMSAAGPKRLTMRTLTRPTSVPTAAPIRAPISRGTCQWAYAAAASTELSTATEPTDRSNWPQI